MKLEMNPNLLVQYLDKPASEFTKADIIKFFIENEFQMLNFRYIAGDGRLKTLNFVISSRDQLDQILSHGERVDGSSLFYYIDSSASDLYVIPRFRTAFVNPFSEIPTIDILCSYYTSRGERLASSPEHIVRRAHDVFKKETGLTFTAMGELEYYVIFDKDPLYQPRTQQGYHESAPYTKWEFLRCEAMQAVAQTGGSIKYGHSEVGNILTEDLEMEQHEIEFLPVPIEDAADQIVLAKWILRMLGYKYGVSISFAPKVLVGHAGSGLHIHTKLLKNGHNAMIEDHGISDTARRLIAGMLNLAPSLTAFGNTVPLSYLRLVPGQEAPTSVCWGDTNRSALVRVPLGWLRGSDMVRDANPKETADLSAVPEYQTVEFRAPDGSANIHLLLAGLAAAGCHGLKMADALKNADQLYIKDNIHDQELNQQNHEIKHLPTSCWASAQNLRSDRRFYESNSVFPAGVIDGIIQKLEAYHDNNLSQDLFGKVDDIKKIVDRYLYSF